MPPLEYCYNCNSPTGRAGRSEDSLYLGDIGPLCEVCYDEATEELISVDAACAALVKSATCPCHELNVAAIRAVKGAS